MNGDRSLCILDMWEEGIISKLELEAGTLFQLNWWEAIQYYLHMRMEEAM